MRPSVSTGLSVARRTRVAPRQSRIRGLSYAADVALPLESVPNFSEGRDEETIAALSLGARIATELELPVFFYGRLTDDGREPRFFRRGGSAGLQARMDAGELVPDRGPTTLHPSAGGVLVGVRRPLIAFNVNLRTTDVEVAQEIARLVRESEGGYPGVRALGLRLPSAGM